MTKKPQFYIYVGEAAFFDEVRGNLIKDDNGKYLGNPNEKTLYTEQNEQTIGEVLFRNWRCRSKATKIETETGTKNKTRTKVNCNARAFTREGEGIAQVIYHRGDHTCKKKLENGIIQSK